MEPSTKRRKLAPKVATPTESIPPPVQHVHEPPHYPVLEPPVAERHDFETFARHLQDAAMLIQRQTELPQYSDVSVLMLRWEGDESQDDDLVALDKLFNTVYHFHTQRWRIPNCANPSVKLGVQIAAFLDNPRPDHLLIVYYAGHGFVGPDKHLYWASNTRDDSAKLKWDGVRCLFEDAQSDMLLLLDTCAIPDPAASGNNGIKEVIAACTPDHSRIQGRSFTSQLVEVFHKLSGQRSFDTQRLYDEILALQHHHIRQGPPPPPTVNGAPHAKLPLFFPITPAKSQHLTLAPATRRSPLTPSHNGTDLEVKKNPTTEEQLIEPEAVAEIKFEEARILVCTTYVGDASADMSYFHNWLQNTPSMGAKVTVEGMFLGPPTMLLISMPHSLWRVIEHDKVCCYLGNITSHNMLHLYQRLVGPSGPKPSPREVEDGRILLEARRAAAVPVPPTPVSSGGDPREFPAPGREHPRVDLPKIPPPTPPTGRGPYISPSASGPLKRDREHEGSAEMREAAEQLKALSHVRHRSDETGQTGRPRTSLPNGILPADGQRDDPNGSPKAKSPPNRVKVPRHALPKNETICNHCSHTPFRDSSSLRKHIAAAHTRPFPCAFSFAGCNSTFGSKNEWKRHITSQHLCLQYYRCSACPQSAIEGKGNEFNRKDLFTQHLRRMHAPFQIKRPASKNDSKMQSEWEIQVKQLQESCLVTRRQPPQRAACPKPDCQHTFEGHSAWDEWTEHVGRHMEKGEANNLPVDRNLIDWALRESIIESKQDGEYRLCYNNGPSGGGSSGGSNGHSAGAEGSSFMEVKEPISRVTTIAGARPAELSPPSSATVPYESPKRDAAVPATAAEAESEPSGEHSVREEPQRDEGKPLPTSAKRETDAMDIDK